MATTASRTAAKPAPFLDGVLARWRYAESGRRDSRLDLLRGYAVFAMICDHVSNISWFSPFTGGNRFVVSAAEGFVFLAGLVMGMVYGGRMRRHGWRAASEAALRRAAVLYTVTVGLTLLFVALFQFTDLRLWLDRTYGLGLNDPVELFVETLTLHYTYHGTDILWMYTIMIAAVPIMLLFLRFGQTVPLLIWSWIIWLAYQLLGPEAAIPWAATNVNYFPVSAWQLLFVHGMAIGYHRRAVTRLLGRIPTPVYVLGFGTGLAFLVLMHRAYDTGRLAGWPVFGRLAGEDYLVVFDKTTVPPGRILAFVVLAGFAYSLVTVFWVPIRRVLGPLLLPLGTNSLQAYGVHLVLIVVVYNVDILASLYDVSRTANTVLQAVTVGLTFAIIRGWKEAEPRLAAALPDVPAWTVLEVRRHPVMIGSASAILLLLTVAGPFVSGTMTASRQTDLPAAATEADVLRYVPSVPASHGQVTVLLALHGEGQTGPEFAAPLVDVARENGWALIAPTYSWGDRDDPDKIAEVVAETLPGIRTMLDSLAEDTDVSLRSRVLVLGDGRGSGTARLFALFYPQVVAAVAGAGQAPCILPAPERDGEPLPIPLGLADLDRYVGEGFDPDAIRQTAFWIGIAEDGGQTDSGCPWGALAGREPFERARIFADVLGELGVTTEIETASGPSAEETLRGHALAFLRTHDPRHRE